MTQSGKGNKLFFSSHQLADKGLQTKLYVRTLYIRSLGDNSLIRVTVFPVTNTDCIYIQSASFSSTADVHFFYYASSVSSKKQFLCYMFWLSIFAGCHKLTLRST